jgi:uncharacterized membrane protein YoaK (UPF0700 family)
MSKAKTPQTVESLLEREKTKNRRIVTGIFIAVALVVGVIGGYFLSIEVTAQASERVVNSIVLKAQ